MRVIFIAVAVLGLLSRTLAFTAPGDDWYFGPPELPPALLLETRKHTTEQDGDASQGPHAIDRPERVATPLGAPAFPAEAAAFLPRYPVPPRPDATGPPAPPLVAAS